MRENDFLRARGEEVEACLKEWHADYMELWEERNAMREKKKFILLDATLVGQRR